MKVEVMWANLPLGSLSTIHSSGEKLTFGGFICDRILYASYKCQYDFYHDCTHWHI